MNRSLCNLFAVLVLFTSCTHSDRYKKISSDPLLYCKTVKYLNNIVLESNLPPMIASRNYVYANIAAYEVIAAGDKKFQSLSGQIKHLPAMPQPAPGQQIDFSFAAMLAFCKVGAAVSFPEGSMDDYVSDLKKQMDDAGMPSTIFENSIVYGEKVADSILSWSKKDNYAQLRSAARYTVTDTPGRWIPTPPMYAQAIEPHWREMRTLVLDSASQCMPPRPPLYTVADKNSTYYKAVSQVKKIVDSLTEEQKHIANFWDDNSFKLNVIGHVMFATKKFSPPGHWMNITGIICKQQKADFNTTVGAYAETAIALYEGFISCWDEKYRSNFVRPETVITKYFDPNWQPFIQTPPFPEYTSGHAVISAAAAEVITGIFGDNISYTDTSETEFGINSRSFTSVRNAAKEASVSRVYGGIHYTYSCEAGAEEGRKIGEIILQKIKLKK